MLRIPGAEGYPDCGTEQVNVKPWVVERHSQIDC